MSAAAAVNRLNRRRNIRKRHGLLGKHLVEERGHNRTWIEVAGYWRKGRAGFHENHHEG